MKDEKARAAGRAVADTACALAAAVAFVLVWALPGIDDGTRRLVSFALSIVLVIFLLEASGSWTRVRRESRSAR